MANYAHTKSRIWQWTGIILILCLFGGAYWYFQVRASTLNQSQNDLNTNGLVGLWSFNGDDISGTTAYDRSGQGNNGTLTNGPSKTDGKIGQALDFFPNGSDTNAYVTMGDPGSGVLDFGTGDFSVSFWFKGRGFVSQGSSLNGMIMKRAVDSVNAAGWVFYTDSNNGVGLNVNGGSDSSSIYITGGTGKATDNTWHHVVGVRSGTAISLYLDRNRIAIGTLSGSVSNAVALTFGDDNLGSRNFNGTIDEVRMYNRALATTDIESLYTQGGGTKVNTAVSQPQGTGRLDSGLAGYWKMDDGSGTSATDSSTNGNTAYFINTPTWTTGQIGGALDFTDPLENQSLSVADVFDMPDGANFSIAGWFYRSTFNTVDIIIAKTAGLGASYTGYGIYIDDTSDALVLLGADGTDMYTLTSSSTFTGTGWNHFVAVWNDTSANETKLYINGKLENSTASGTFANVGGMSNVDPFHIGSESDIYVSNSRSFRGRLDEIRVYNRTLSADEVAQLYRLNTPTSVDTSLKGYWSFNAPDMTSTTAYDQSGAGDYGVLSNSPAITEGVVGQALLFDGNNDYVNFGVNSVNPRLSGASAITVATWMKPLSYPGNNVGERAFDVQIQNGTVGVFLGLYDDSGLISFGGRSQTSDGSQGTTTYAYPSLNEWHHVIGVMDIANDVVRLYVDGALVASVAVSFGATTYTPGTPTTSLDTLGSNIGFDQFYHGALDETRVYNRVLTTAEIKSLYDVGQSDKVNSSASQPQGTGRLDSGLAGYWKLDENTGTSAADSSTNANTGTLINMENGDWTTGQIGNGLTFDGTNEYINVPGSTLLTPPQTTLATWVKIGSAPTNYGNIAERGGNGGYRFRINNDQTVSFIMVGVSLTTSATVALDTWTHIAVVGSASGRKIYLNGVLSASSATAYNSGTTSGYDFHIGGNTPDAEYFNGSIDEFRIYNRVLSADEVAELYRLNSPTGTDTGLKGYWSFNGKDMSGTSAYDRSGAGNTGTLTNGPAITEGKLGQGLNFDGTDDYVTAGSASVIDNIQTLTVSAWIKTRTYSNLPNIFNKAGVGGGWQVNLCQNSIGVCANAGQTNAFHFVRACEGIGTVRTRSPENSISMNTWQHLAITNDNSAGANTTKFYVNGSLVATDASACVTPRDESSNNLLIGSANGGGQFDGLIDEARLYNRVLTESEIKSLYNSSR